MMATQRTMKFNRMSAAAHASKSSGLFMPMMTAPIRPFASKDSNFMSGSNANYIDYMYAQWQQDPSSVHASWNAYFASDGDFATPATLGGMPVGDTGNNLDMILAALQNQTQTMGGTD